MFVITRLVEGSLFAHAVLLASYAVGTSVLPVRDRADSSAHALMRVVCTCGFGIAAYGLTLFFLGIAGLLSPPFLASAFVAIILAAGLIRKQSPFSFGYWHGRFADLVGCWDVGALVVYAVMLVLAVPAIIPNLGGDPVAYHLAYAEDWARAGKLVIDPFLRFPFYASNFPLLVAALFAVRGDSFVNFLTWATALLTALGVYGSARVFLQRTVAYRWAATAAAALALSVVLSPTFLRWLPTAYVDVAIGAFALISLLCIQLALIENDRRWLAAFAVIAGFLVGMKTSFLVASPILVLMLIISASTIRTGRAYLLLMLALLCVCAAPWYVRNAILAGDPIAPVLNIALHGSDGLMSKAEWEQIGEDLKTSRSFSALISLPVRAFKNPLQSDFREYGSSALILFLFVPMLLVVVEFAFLRRGDAAARLSVLLLTALIVYWFATATMLRYALLFYPMLAVCLAATTAPFLKGRYGGPLVALLAAAAVLPSPGAKEFFRETYALHYKYLPVYDTSDDEYLRRFGQGYVEEQFAAGVLRKNALRGRVYVFGSEFAAAYYFRREGLMSIGDWTGPASYFRLATAVDTHQVVRYFEDLDVVAVEIAATNWPLASFGVPLERQLIEGGFCSLSVPGSGSRLLVRFSGPCGDLESISENRPAGNHS